MRPGIRQVLAVVAVAAAAGVWGTSPAAAQTGERPDPSAAGDAAGSGGNADDATAAKAPVEGAEAAPATSAEGDAAQDKRVLARRRVEEGDTAYRLSRFEEALAAYQEALALVNHPALLFNIAQCYRQMANAERALFYYQLYLSEWPRRYPDKPVPAREEVTGHVTRLKLRLDEQARRRKEEERARRIGLGQVRLAGVPEGARVLVDGTFLKRGPLDKPLDVRTGLRRLKVSLDGFVPWEQAVEVENGQMLDLSVHMELAPGNSRLYMGLGIASTVLCAGALGAGLGLNIMANNEVRDSEPFNDYKYASIAGYTTAAVTAAASAVLWYLLVRERADLKRRRKLMSARP